MERNFKNYIVWESPGETLLEERRLKLSLESLTINTEEVQALFDTKISTELLGSETVALENAPVQVSTRDTGEEVTINLDVNSSPPYVLRKDGEQIDSGLTESDFPYVDDNVQVREETETESLDEVEEVFSYEIEDKIENTYTEEVSVVFDLS